MRNVLVTALPRLTRSIERLTAEEFGMPMLEMALVNPIPHQSRRAAQQRLGTTLLHLMLKAQFLKHCIPFNPSIQYVAVVEIVNLFPLFVGKFLHFLIARY
jgi:hypothetical protein